MDVIGSDSFSEQLAQRLDAGHIRLEKRLFSNLEVCPRLSQNPRQDVDEVILAERMALPETPNRYMMEVLLTLKNLRAMKVGNITMVMPYLVYSKQDRTFRPGEPFSARHVLEMLHESGVSRLFTVSSHMERFKPMLTAPMPAYNIDGYSILGEHLKDMRLREPVVISPDMAVSMAADRVAGMLGTSSVDIDKTRDLETGIVSARQLDMDFGGRDIVIVDDMIASGGTMVKAIETAESCNSGRVVVAAVHIVQQSAIDLLKRHAWKVITTDTVATPMSEVSVIAKIAETIKGSRPGASRPAVNYNYDSTPISKTSESTEPAAGAFSMFD
jgi:ribose-phosphate pyrophosphokinase